MKTERSGPERENLDSLFSGRARDDPEDYRFSARYLEIQNPCDGLDAFSEIRIGHVPGTRTVKESAAVAFFQFCK
jgi:hypothetical protein